MHSEHDTDRNASAHTLHHSVCSAQIPIKHLHKFANSKRMLITTINEVLICQTVPIIILQVCEIALSSHQ